MAYLRWVLIRLQQPAGSLGLAEKSLLRSYLEKLRFFIPPGAHPKTPLKQTDLPLLPRKHHLMVMIG